jgi:hypothetical protein
MRANGARAWSLTAVVLLLALAGSVDLAGAQARPVADSVAEGARKITEVEQRAKAAGAQSRPVAEKLEKSAQGFGESIWDGMKSAGCSLQKFFTGG